MPPPPADDGREGPALTLRSVDGLAAISRAGWDAVANPPDAEYDPFLSWDFLEALEASGCVGEATGWLPRHLLLEDASGTPAGALPLYIKTHSMGEYVFDHGWADAFERAGGQYFPKFLTAVPFSPVTGRRILARDPVLRQALVAGAVQTAQQWGVSSWHVTFPGRAEWSELGELGLLQRMDRQFIWHNRGYGDYDDFLADLSSRKRKGLRRERREAQAGIEIERLGGDDLQPHHWDVFFACYQETGSRKWGSPYLNREFFDLLHRRMANRVILVMAKLEGRYIAAALNLVGSNALYGRYWGRLEDRAFLHFELCYHQAIDIAIERGLDRVEAGAQGEHKLARGYRAAPVYSAHFIAHQGFRDAVADFLDRERAAVEAEIALQDEESPFRSRDR
jgi:hypothetical protein